MVGLQSECKIMWNLNPRYNETEFIHKCHIDHSLLTDVVALLILFIFIKTFGC